MKTMNCKQLGGACAEEFRGETFEEMAEQSKQHAMEMLQKQDAAHLSAMEQMKELMKDPKAMADWFESKKKEFAELPND